MLLICGLTLSIRFNSSKGFGTLIEFRTIFTLAPDHFAFDHISYFTKRKSKFPEAYTVKPKSSHMNFQ